MKKNTQTGVRSASVEHASEYSESKTVLYDETRLAKLKIMVHDSGYIAHAVNRLATTLSDEIIDELGARNGKWK